MITSPNRFKFTVKDFYALDEMGLFEDHKVELWDGDIVEMSMKPPHAKSVAKGQKEFERSFGDRALIYSQLPLDLGTLDAGLLITVPQPDLMIVKTGDYLDKTGKDRHAKPDDVLLLVEISDSSLSYDQNRKLQTYAKHGIVEYWIADLNSQTWFVYREPEGDTYRFKTTYRFGEAFAPSAFPDVAKAWLAAQ
jgi:Uma2 family endonuclease